MQLRREHTSIGRPARRRIQHDRPGPVAEQDAGAAVLPVEDPRKGLGADHQRGARLTQPQGVVGGRQRKDEPRAHRLHVERGAALHAEPRLELDRGRREGLVGRCRREYDQVEVAAAHPGALEGAARRLESEVRGQLPLGGDAALADPGALPDPRIRRVEPRRQLVIGDDALGEIAAAPGHSGAQSHARALTTRPIARSTAPG